MVVKTLKMNQQQSSSSAAISVTRANKRLRGSSSTSTTDRKENGTSQNPATSMNDKCTSINAVSRTTETSTSNNDSMNSADDTNATNGYTGHANKRPRSRSSSSTGNHPTTGTVQNGGNTTTTTSTTEMNISNGISEESMTKSALPERKEESTLVPQMTNDYVELASHMMLYPLSQIRAANLIASGQANTTTTTATTNVSANLNGTNNRNEEDKDMVAPMLRMIPQSQYLVHMSALGYLKSPIRRPSVIERWSPYEIAMFEASIAEYGKNFSSVQKEIGRTKSVQDVIEFYYIWKKTSHYAQWKKQYIPEYLDADGDE